MSLLSIKAYYLCNTCKRLRAIDSGGERFLSKILCYLGPSDRHRYAMYTGKDSRYERIEIK